MGRTKLEINWAVLDALVQRGATKVSAAAILEVSHDTIERRIEEKYGCNFEEYKAQKFEKTKAKLVERAIDKALNGDNTMLIFCLKNLCGWADKIESEFSNKEAFQVVFNDKPKLVKPLDDT